MKRSSAKLLSLAGSVRNINKDTFKFRYEIHIRQVGKILSNGNVCVTWERNGKVLATKPVLIDGNRTAHFGEEVLSQVITLFKKKENSTFEPKPFKLTIRKDSAKGRVLGKMCVNFAEYVEIPSFCKLVSATLSCNCVLIFRCISTFIHEEEVKKSFESIRVRSFSSFASDAMTSTGQLDYLDVLKVKPPALPRIPTQKKRVPPVPAPLEKPAAPVKRMRRRRPPDPTPEQGKGDFPPPHGMGVQVDGNRSDNITNGNSGPSRAEVRQKGDALTGLVQVLNQRLESNTMVEENTHAIEQLLEQNGLLRRDMSDLQEKLSRGPVYADVRRDLREAKLALAIFSTITIISLLSMLLSMLLCLNHCNNRLK